MAGRKMTRGWWTLSAEMFDGSELDDSDREHIAKSIREGYTSGELIHEDE